jgi:hypothetical protein
MFLEGSEGSETRGLCNLDKNIGVSEFLEKIELK